MIQVLHDSKDYTVYLENEMVLIETKIRYKPSAVLHTTIDEWNQAVSEAEPHSGYSKEDLAANHLWLTL